MAAGYPTDCTLCHRASDPTWNDGTFSHPYFPITGGPHASADCVDCHPNPSNFGVFNCLDAGCHPQSDMDDRHESEGDAYQYDSAFCYGCHPDGKPPPRISFRTRASHG